MKLYFAAPIALATLLLFAQPSVAATDAERIQQLEEQLRQQRQLMEQQQQMLEQMQSELQQLKATPTAEPEDVPQELAQADPYEPVVTGDKVGAPLSVNLYGFVMADMIYDFKRVDPDWEDTLRVSTIPTESGLYGNDGEFITSVRQSRLGVKGNYGPDVTFLLEAELFGVGNDAGQTTPRLRHAWATYKNFGMGQYWSNFMDPDIFPNTIDYWGPTGMVFYRNQQARYTIPLGEDEFTIALEDPSTALTIGRFRDVDNCDLPTAPPECESSGSTAEEVFQAHNEWPDLSMHYRNNGDFGHYQIAGILRDLGYERLDNGADESELGWGINTSAGIRFFERDMLKLQVVYGEGIGNYMNDGGIDIAPSSADITQADAKTVPLLGIVAYYDHYWNERWSTSLGWSMTDLDTTSGQADSEFAEGQIAQINLLHYPRSNVMLGSEFSWGERRDIDGDTGTDYRIQFSLKVGFDTGDLVSR
ncbi:MAG: DcaP family trimeric outer membrane transporter [Pseudomonadota bacterium]